MMEALNHLASILDQNLIIALPVVFLAGFISSFGPCVFTTLPLVVGYMGNSNIQDKKKGLRYSLVFTLGLAVTFVAMGIVTALAGMYMARFGKYLYIILALVMIISAMYMLGLFRFGQPQNMCKIEDTPKKGGYLGIFLLGLFGGVASTPCATPVLAAILSFVATSGNLVLGGLMLLFYSLGHGVIFIMAGVSITFVNKMLQNPANIKKGTYIKNALAVLILIAGMYIFYNAI